MTTVGYGDKTPKSVVGRLFTVVWILVGIIMFNILTGEVIRVIFETIPPDQASMIDQKVGTLGRMYDNSLIEHKADSEQMHGDLQVVTRCVIIKRQLCDVSTIYCVAIHWQ